MAGRKGGVWVACEWVRMQGWGGCRGGGDQLISERVEMAELLAFVLERGLFISHVRRMARRWLFFFIILIIYFILFFPLCSAASPDLHPPAAKTAGWELY